MKKGKWAAIIGILMIIFALTGCGETLSERAAAKEECESFGGSYKEHINGFNYDYWYYTCHIPDSDNE